MTRFTIFYIFACIPLILFESCAHVPPPEPVSHAPRIVRRFQPSYCDKHPTSAPCVPGAPREAKR